MGSARLGRFCRIAIVALVALLLRLPGGAAAAPPGPPPAAGARIWIYRDWDPYTTLQTPYVRLNGAVIGVSEPGGAFYRDVPAGTYRVTVDSYGTDYGQFATVAAVPGQTVFVKVYANNWWAGVCWNCQRDTFYTRLIPPAEAEAEIAHERLPLFGG
jgi:hypothetical protein